MVPDKLPVRFGVDFKGMSKEQITYCIFLIHALGLTWNSGDKYQYTKEIVGRVSMGSLRKNSEVSFGWDYRELPSGIQKLSLNTIENIFKKAVSKHRIEPFDYGQVMAYKEKFLQGE